MALESAIPPHLACERALLAKTPANYVPPFPAYSARFPTDVKDLVMALIGAQHREGAPTAPSSALAKLNEFLKRGTVSYQPKYRQPSSVTDNAGAYNEVLIAYWRSKAQYTEWASTSGFNAWWRNLDPETEDHGWFLEVLYPSVDRFETVFSDNVVPEGAAHMRESVSGEIQEHVY
ncbi:hypothetical protein B0A55_12415 [Friedmanniomyces simplex]|uniref:Uncharacterized protein n=1 Tax=Friedmanniomyces simplex TaxID=329884 RepID=A0A4U0W261_9PEZI|nr:hypothetical protein B0A55_12415 [Friedmanniomyces simplex]